MNALSTPTVAGILDTSASVASHLVPVPIQSVEMQHGFWKPRLKGNLSTGLPRLLDFFEQHGILDNFRRVGAIMSQPRQGPCFTDSDVYKWMEGAAWALASDAGADIRPHLENTIEIVAKAQRPDGYINTFFTDELENQRWRNMPQEHELYCAGHLIQAAIAHYRITGQENLLDIACRFADYLVDTFGPNKKQGYSGHEEVEMALVELYRTTHEKKYLDLAGFFLREIGVVGQTEAWGHAVRALYRACGVADYYAETGDQAFLETAQAVWTDMTTRKMYVTGGMGSRHGDEAFGEPYELPNARAYAETCAALGSVFFNARMLAITGNAKYADQVELALYNGFLAGVALSHSAYFYTNPLASYGKHSRFEWHECTCCPTNAVRALASLPGYMFSTSTSALWVHLFDSCQVELQLPDGPKTKLIITTNYPWEPTIQIQVMIDQPAQFTLQLRVPGWCACPSATINGEAVLEELHPGTYLALKRTWNPSDEIQLVYEMPVETVSSHPLVTENRGCVALMRGPLVYCVESSDNPHLNPHEMSIDPVQGFSTQWQPELLGGVTTIRAHGRYSPVGENQPLYAPTGAREILASRRIRFVAIPYYAWSNRGPSHMAVWLPRI